jgi:plastocyanin
MPATPAPPNTGRRKQRAPLLVVALAGSVAVVLVAFWFAGFGGSTARPSPAAEHVAAIDILNFKFTPAEVTVKAGTTVRWTNHGYVPHTVDFTGEAVHSGVLNNGNQFTHTFTTPGTYPYICHIHPFMHGTVAVIP